MSTKSRTFRIIDVIKLENGKYKTIDHHLMYHKNRYVIKNGQLPLCAAYKSFRKLVEKKPNIKNFVLMEITRNCNNKLYFYEGKMVKRKNVKHLVFKKDKNRELLKEPKIVNITHDPRIHSVSSAVLGHSNPLSSWN